MNKYSPNWYWRELGYKVISRHKSEDGKRRIFDSNGIEVILPDDKTVDRHKLESRVSEGIYKEKLSRA